MMDLLVSFHCCCRGVEFYDLCSVAAACGTKLDLVKEPTNSHDSLCVVAWVLGIPGERRWSLTSYAWPHRRGGSEVVESFAGCTKSPGHKVYTCRSLIP